MRNRLVGALASIIVGTTLLPPAAPASPAALHWSTYLRAGPGTQYTAIDELEHGASVDLGACAGQWCKVSDGAIVGYVDKDSLLLPAPPSGATGAVQSCFRSAQTSYRNPTLSRFCASATTPRTQPGR